MTDYNLIDRLYQKMVDIKITIMYKINAFIFNTDGYQYTEKMFRAKQEAEKILNNLLNELILIHFIQNRSLERFFLSKALLSAITSWLSPAYSLKLHILMR